MHFWISALLLLNGTPCFTSLLSTPLLTAVYLVLRDLGYRTYNVEGNPDILYKPFVSVYLGAAYLKWLSNFVQKERSEEFVVRACKCGTKKATHKSTLQHWKRYLSVKESLPSSYISSYLECQRYLLGNGWNLQAHAHFALDM